MSIFLEYYVAGQENMQKPSSYYKNFLMKYYLIM